MIFSLELKKLKRTGYMPAFLGGAVLAAAVPLLHMLVRSETFIVLPGEPLNILYDANWQMMAMLNILTIICCACITYHTMARRKWLFSLSVATISLGENL